MKNITTSLEVSKQLKANGYPQESLFYWTVDHQVSEGDIAYGNYDHWYLIYCENGVNKELIEKGDLISAPTASELMEMLPSEIETKDNIYFLKINKFEKDYYGVMYANLKMMKKYLPKVKLTHDKTLHSETDKNFCNCLAKIYLYLKYNNLLKEK